MKNMLTNLLSNVTCLLILFFVFSLPLSTLAENNIITKLQTKSSKGDREAQNLLGVKYFSGDDVQQDHLKAAELFTRSARQGLAKAQFNLAYMYHKGIGIPQDYTKACVWYNAAADQGHSDAQESLNSLKGYMNSEKVAEIERLSAQIPINAAIARNSQSPDTNSSNPELMSEWLKSIQPAAGK